MPRAIWTSCHSGTPSIQPTQQTAMIDLAEQILHDADDLWLRAFLLEQAVAKLRSSNPRKSQVQHRAESLRQSAAEHYRIVERLAAEERDQGTRVELQRLIGQEPSPSIPSAPLPVPLPHPAAKAVGTDATQPSRKFIKLRDILRRIPVSRSQIYKRIADGTFPKPLHMGGRSAFWLESEVDAWIEQYSAFESR